MKLKRTILAMALMLVSAMAWADVSTWTHEWNVSRANGGEGFYHISNNDDTIQTTTLKGLEWTYSSNCSVTAFSASTGQYFGSAASPVSHATLSTSLLRGKILSVTIEAKVKTDEQNVNIGVSVNGQTYSSPAQLTATRTAYTFAPAADAAEGEIVITMDQTSETKGIIYFHKITIEYDGEGVAKPDPKDPEMSYAVQTIEIECGDNAYANYLTNPYNVSPITYSCSDPDLAALNNSGDIFTTGRKTGSAIVTASFAGNDEYLAGSASYTLVVKEKPVIPAPDFDVKGGSFTEPVTVTITSNDPLCKAIWYSTTISDVNDLGYDDETIIVPGKTAVVTLTESCTLLAVAVGDNNIGLPATYTFDINIPLQADFGAEESAQNYYNMGWDSIEEASTWTYYGINESTWTLSPTAPFQGIPQFTAIDPTSQYSLTIFYDNSSQRERAVSPEIEVRPNSSVEFYMALCGVWMVYADLKLLVNDITAGTQTEEFSAFNWCQDNSFEGPSWEKFKLDMSKYAGHTVTFEFIYEGAGGDNIAIDNFKVLAEDATANQINIMEGESIHFKDLSMGNPTAWNWTIDGGTPATSNEQNPVVAFEKAGKYTVKLVAYKGNETSEAVKTDFIVVNVAAPKAHIGVPTEAYYSPYAYAFVPVNVPVQFHDKSTGNPTSYNWTFEGTDVASSDEKDPIVTYTNAGRYGLELTVANSAGSARDFLVDAIQAGGTQEVWNIAPEEIDNIGTVALGWYGYYGGTNWLGMKSFAEHYHAPAAQAQVEGATIYFAETTTSTPDALFTVQMCAANEDGLPGAVLATATKKLSELNYSETEVLPTVFTFDTPVEVTEDFFIVVDGFPNDYTDNVVILTVARQPGEFSSVCHLIEDEDENYEPLGTYTWYAQDSESPVSMCVAANVTFTNVQTAVTDINVDKSNVTGIYDVLGRKLNAPQRGINIIDGKKIIFK